MGTLSLDHPPRRRRAPSALLPLLALLFLLSALQAPTQGIPATSIPLLLPSAIVFDPAGNLYLADTANHVIRKVDLTGAIVTLAGNGTQGFSGDNGPATAAQLDSPQGLALDKANNLYIADTHNHRIRRIDAVTGLITTIAGTGTPGFSGDSAPATAARLSLPTALAADTQNNLYLADTGNHRIRVILAATGEIVTLAGNGTQGFSGDNGLATAASIDSPTGLAVDAADNLYLADTHNHRIRRIAAATGLITTLAGTGIQGFSGDNGPANASTLALPQGLTLDAANNLYLADTENHRIRRVDATTGLLTTVAGTGTQGFSGDSGLATAASLDTPTSTALSPASLLTLADTGNQRIRQRNAQAAIQTIAGLATPGALSLTAPSAILYGTGTLTASLASSTAATGRVTFLDTFHAATTTLATLSLTDTTATLDTSTLPAGLHSIVASYAGDPIHPATQSSAFTLTILPQPLTATINPITLLYGQPVPPLTGTLTGILPRDATNLTAAFTTIATTLSPVGSYPILATLNGPAAGNYALPATTASVTILPATILITLTDLLATGTTAALPGTPITFTSHVASSTTGFPTGTVTLLDGSAPLLTSPVSPAGDSTFTSSSLFQGIHTLTARYSGDANFTPSTSIPSVLTIGTAPPPTTGDFALTATGTTSQTIVSGSSASFTFTVQFQGDLSSPITLAATGLPNLATASFNPAYLPPGSTTNTFTLTISTPNTSATPNATASQHHPQPPPMHWAILLLPIAGLTLRPRHPHKTRYSRKALAALAVLTITLPLFSGCGNRVETANSSTNPTTTYTITVTGTATTPTSSILQHSTAVTLNLQPLN
jgi:sugar lactone lactonase YvrE